MSPHSSSASGQPCTRNDFPIARPIGVPSGAPSGAPDGVPDSTAHGAPGVGGTLDEARATLRRFFGYTDFRPVQRRAVEAVLSGRDALIVLPTGGGKSLCYQVPALMREGLTIVISPLISLMQDQVEALARRGINAAYLNSTLSASETTDRLARARDGSLRLLYLAPERLAMGSTAQRLAEIGVALLAIDEAHCISEWGHSFRPSYRGLGRLRLALGSPQTVALTATATPVARADIAQQLALQQPTLIIGGFDRPNLHWLVHTLQSPRDKMATAIRLLRAQSSPAIVYAPTRKAVESIAATLVHGGIRAVAYHAGLHERLRLRAQNAFMDERARVIVATSAFGMGIDKPDVRLVVHHAMPGSLEAYYQEAGRAGRDGRQSSCLLLHHRSDRLTQEYFIAATHPSREAVVRTWQALRAKVTPNGRVACTSRDLQRDLAGRKTGALSITQVEAALRVLVQAGACRRDISGSGLVQIRLLAKPERIRRELTGGRAGDLEVLRALWRAVGDALEAGTSIDLNALPQSLGGFCQLVPVLERLMAQQFLTWTRRGGGFVLDPRSRDAQWLPVDWQQMERRRQTDIGRLEAMQRYAQTRQCRRAFVLRYFGDPEVRLPCDACDRCLGLTTFRSSAATGCLPRPLSRMRARRSP